MSDTTNVWVKTALLEKVITGKTTKQLKRGLPTGEDDEEFIDWGWAYATLKNRDDSFIEISINDENSPHHGLTTKLSPDSFKTGDLLSGNKYTNDEDFDQDEDEGHYPDDLIVLTHLHEAEVVHCLRQRYMRDKIYTSTGPILLALNPFKNCKQLYSKSVMEQYTARGELYMRGITDDENPLPPHVYGIADRSFRIMMQTMEENSGPKRLKGGSGNSSDQSILVSGESGAGKTVTTKFIMQYLASLSQRTNNSDDAKEKGGPNIEQQVLQSNPILESFGNARTIRNDNSSRFGKFIEMKFNREGALVGASIQSYLLEKVRLISQAEGERNYHIFYEIFCMGDEMLENYNLEIYNPEDFTMTNRSGTYDRRDGVEDFETYDDLKKAMDVLGMTKEEVDSVITIAAAALHGSNVTFLDISSDESELDLDNPHLAPFLKLMGLKKEDLGNALCYLQIKAGKEVHKRTLSKAKAEKGMEALIKAFYGALFHFLVRRINSSITVRDGSTTRRRVSSSSNADGATIGVLDIFGFESFKHNSFEQLCINYCNEALQQQFNLFVLKNEQAEYKREGIEWSFISFPDNQEVLDLIDKKGSGILNILDDQCRAPGTTDKTFSIDIYNKCTGHPRFEADFRQVGAQLFGVKHYAGPVEYNTIGFVEKNKDELPKEASDLLFGSVKEIVQELATILSDPNTGSAESKARSVSPSRPGAKTAKVTVGSQFSKQLRDLRSKIDLTSPHYVRCLKPNDVLVPDHFNPLIISDQLKYAGVIEAVRVSRVGYPHRYAHNAFVARYQILAASDLKKAQRSSKRQKPATVVVNSLAAKVWRVQCEQEIKDGETEKKPDEPPNLISVGIQVGKTKVFLRRTAYEIIEQLRSAKNGESAEKIQKVGRGYIVRRDFQTIRRGVIALQCLARVHAAVALVHDKRSNYRATRIQTVWRKEVKHKHFLVVLTVAKWMQRVQRGREGRRRYEDLNRIRKATAIQVCWRCSSARRQFIRTISSVVIIQCLIRCRIARRVYKEAKLQSRDLNSALAERDNLKKEAQLLRQQLLEAQSALSMTSANQVSIDPKEVEAAQAQIKELQDEVDRFRLSAAESISKVEEYQKRAAEAEAASALHEAKANEQFSRAEKYKKRFVDDHEALKKLKIEKEQDEVKLADLHNKLKAAENLGTQDLEYEKVAKEELEKELAALQSDLSVAREQISAYTADLEETAAERDSVRHQLELLMSELSDVKSQLREVTRDRDSRVVGTKVSSTQAMSTMHASSVELEAARAELTAAQSTIRRLEAMLAEPQLNGVTIDQRVEHEAMIRELEETQDQAVADLKRKDSKIAMLEKELEEARTLSPKTSAHDSEGMASLRDEIKSLKKQLNEAKKTQSAGEVDPNSPAGLAQRYEELRRLADAGIAKDREIERLKAIIEEIETDEQPSELNNNEETDALRSYIHELQTEISKLREDYKASHPEPQRRNSLMSIITGTTPKSEDYDRDVDSDDRLNDLEDEVVALKEVNGSLRSDIEKSRKRIQDLEKDLKDERETSKRELESFARTLRGVDELRTVAENMSRQVKQFKHQAPTRLSGSGPPGSGFQDEVVEDFENQFDSHAKMIDSARKTFEQDALGKTSPKRAPQRSFWGLDLLSNKEPEFENPPSSDEMEEDLRKIIAASKQKRKLKKKRRGSGNSIVSSFF